MSGDPGTRHDVVVGEGGAGRLDSWLAATLGLSRTRAAALVGQGRVLVDGKVPRKSEPVAPGQRIEVDVPPPETLGAEPEDIPLDIVYEDASLLVVDKPAGMVVHPAPGHPRGTLVNALLHHVHDLSGIGGTLRPGIVHRLDRDTSGLLVVAKNDISHRVLSDALKARTVKRLYLTASWGHLASTPLTIEAPVGRHASDRMRMAVVEGSRPALTRAEVLERWRSAEFLQVSLGTGRTHQIRVHLAHIGHPVVGDALYGPDRHKGMGGSGRAWAAALAAMVPRQFLHAAELSFDHPETGVALTFRSPLPPDLEKAAAWARTTP